MNVRLVLLSATLACLVLLRSLHSAHGQAYHFSNGWNPGKKRSSPAQASASSSTFPEPLLASLTSNNEPSSVLHSLGMAQRLFTITLCPKRTSIR